MTAGITRGKAAEEAAAALLGEVQGKDHQMTEFRIVEPDGLIYAEGHISFAHAYVKRLQPGERFEVREPGGQWQPAASDKFQVHTEVHPIQDRDTR